MQTKRICVGQLGIVLPAANPIRVAEDIAMLDQMTGGRANAGFARGYQRRWVDIWRSRRTSALPIRRALTTRSRSFVELPRSRARAGCGCPYTFLRE
jgi:alkanesulfonate monooxygenase SsuD/methylene tetrahydromethanopterin reductase-like flavin-dependent oxidoreductase (luciferase family)